MSMQVKDPEARAWYEKEAAEQTGVEFTISFFITDAVLAATLKDLFEDGIIDRKSYDEIPPPVKLFLTEKGKSVVPILRGICEWSDIFYKEDSENTMTQYQKCDHRR